MFKLECIHEVPDSRVGTVDNTSARLEDLGSPQMVASHLFHPSLSKRGSEEDVLSHVYSRVP